MNDKVFFYLAVSIAAREEEDNKRGRKMNFACFIFFLQQKENRFFFVYIQPVALLLPNSKLMLAIYSIMYFYALHFQLRERKEKN